MILQLNPHLDVIVTSKGNAEAEAIGWIDYSPSHDLCWICHVHETGEVWIVPNSEIRMHRNWTFGRSQDAPGAEKRDQDGRTVGLDVSRAGALPDQKLDLLKCWNCGLHHSYLDGISPFKKTDGGFKCRKCQSEPIHISGALEKKPYGCRACGKRSVLKDDPQIFCWTEERRCEEGDMKGLYFPVKSKGKQCRFCGFPSTEYYQRKGE